MIVAGFDATQVSLFFAIVPTFYMLFAFPAGALSDKGLCRQKTLLGIGCVGLATSFMTFTTPWDPEHPLKLWCILSNVIFGAASTLVTVPQMPDLRAEAERKLPRLSAEGSKRRTNLVSATYTTFQNSGGFVVRAATPALLSRACIPG